MSDPTARALLREGLTLLRRVWRPALAYGFGAWILTAAVISPVLSWLLFKVFEFTRGGAVLNYDLASLAVSLDGLLLLFLWSTVVSVFTVVGLGGPVVLTVAAADGDRPSATWATSRVARGLRGLRGIGLLKLAAWSFSALPLATLVGAAVLSLALAPFGWMAHERVLPRGLAGLPLAIAGGAVLVLVALGLYVRWCLCLHGLVVERRTIGEAMKRSAALVRGSYGLVARAVLGHLGISALALGVLVLATAALTALVVGRLDPEGAAFPIVLSAVLVVDGLLVGSVLILASAWGAAVHTSLWWSKGGRPPEAAPAASAGRVASNGRARIAWAAGLGAVFAAAAVATIPNVLQEMERLDRPVEITAHRGSSGEAPENTLAAIRLAIEDGADGCEFDVLQAKDGAIVVVHDENLKRVAGVDRNVWEMTGDELTALDVGSHLDPRFAAERIPRLADVIRLAKGRIRLNIEVKVHGHETEDYAASVVRAVEAGGIAGDCVITSLDARILARIRALRPDLRIGQIITAMVGKASALDVDFYSVQPMYATVDFIRSAHRIRREVHVWGVNDEEAIRRSIDRGADNLITDYPKVARAAVDARTPWDNLMSAVGRLFRR